MSFYNIKDKFLTTIRRIKPLKNLHIDTYTEEKIKNITGTKIASSKAGEMWINFQDLNGFLFINVNIISFTNLKTNKGASLIIKMKNTSYQIKSDEHEIRSEFSNISNTWITSVSFIISNKERDLIKFRKFDEIEYLYKKQGLNFKAFK